MHPHIVPKSIYYRVAGWLFILMVLTVAAALLDLGWWNTPIAMAIAIVKATLIVLFFMHVKYGTQLLKLFAASGFLWLLLLFGLTLSDYMTRR